MAFGRWPGSIIVLLIFNLFTSQLAPAADKRSCLAQLKKDCAPSKHRSREAQLKCAREFVKKEKDKDCQELVKRKLHQIKTKVKANKKVARRHKKVEVSKAEEDEGSVLGGLVFFFLAILILWIEVALSVLFGKAGYHRGLAFVPGLNFYLLHRIAGVPWWWCLCNLTPALLMFWPKTCVAFAESFGQTPDFGYGLAVIPFVNFPLLAFTEGVEYEGRGAMPSIDFDLSL